MSRRFPFHIAIAGLTAFAVATPTVVVPANNSIIAAAIAQAAEAVTVTGESTVAAKQPATFTATVPGATTGKVQFFLDGVLVATTDVNGEGVATASITPKSYGEHTLTSRYITTRNDVDYTLNPDGTTTFTTPLPTKFEMDGKGNTGTDGDTYDGFTINKQVSSIDNPIELQPGETYTLNGRMTTAKLGRLFEVGLNPSPGSTYVEGTGARYHADSDNADSSVAVKTRADENGLSITESGSLVKAPGWGQTTDGQTWPTVNEGYIGFQHKSSYTVTKGTTWELGGDFIAPDIPGIHIPQYAAYKYMENLHVLVPMNEATFKISPKELPPRNDLPAEQTTLTVSADKGTVTEGTESRLTATITPANAAGTVQFKNNGENIGDPAPVANGTAELTHTLPLGANEITAEFTPDNPATFTPATGKGTTVNVEKLPATATTLTYMGDRAGTVNKPAQLKAKVNPDTPGTVQFFELIDVTPTPLSDPIQPESGVATTTYTPDSTGTKSFKAVFTPTDVDAFAGSETTFELEVEKQATTLQLTAEDNKKGGDHVAITATVTPQVDGTVEFFNGDQSLGTSPVDTATGTASGTASGTATISDTFPTGRHDLRAVFTPTAGDTYSPAEATHTLVIGSRDKKDTTLDLAANPNELTLGESTTVTATIAGATTGLVTYTDDNGVQGWAPVTNGTATFTYTPKTDGAKTIKAEYVPTDGAADTHNGSTGTTTVTVNPAPPVTPEKHDTAVLLAGPSKVTTGDDIDLTALVTPANAAGTVTFHNGTDIIGTTPVMDGKATFTIKDLPKGSYQFKATFTPADTAAFNPSESTHSAIVADEKPAVTVTNTTTQVEPTTVVETERETVRETTTQVEPTTVTEVSTQVEPTTVTTTVPTTVNTTTTESVTVTTTATAQPEKQAPATPAVDASRAIETTDGREITLTAGTSPKTKGRMVFELSDGTKLGDAPIDPDGTARFKHTFDKPGQYEVRAYVLAEDGTEGERSVPLTVTVAEKTTPDTPDTPGDGGSSTSTDASSSENNRAISFAIGGSLLALLLGALAAVVLQSPPVRQWFEQMGIRY